MSLSSVVLAIVVLIAGLRGLTPPELPLSPAHRAVSDLQHVPILLYHHVDDQAGPWHVPKIDFAQQVAYLSESGFHSVSMADYTEAFQKSANLPEKSVILTFDDAYDDAYTNVFPLLKEYGLKGTFFIITGKVGQPGYLTWDQIGEMFQAGMEFGGHTVNHPFLTKLAEADAYLEMSQSRLDLQMHLGVPVVTFAYPYNDHDAVLLKIAALAGYKSACIADLHTGDPEPDIYAIPRITISAGESMSVFQLVTSRGYRGLALARHGE